MSHGRGNEDSRPAQGLRLVPQRVPDGCYTQSSSCHFPLPLDGTESDNPWAAQTCTLRVDLPSVYGSKTALRYHKLMELLPKLLLCNSLDDAFLIDNHSDCPCIACCHLGVVEPSLPAFGPVGVVLGGFDFLRRS